MYVVLDLSPVLRQKNHAYILIRVILMYTLAGWFYNFEFFHSGAWHIYLLRSSSGCPLRSVYIFICVGFIHFFLMGKRTHKMYYRSKAQDIRHRDGQGSDTSIELKQIGTWVSRSKGGGTSVEGWERSCIQIRVVLLCIEVSQVTATCSNLSWPGVKPSLSSSYGKIPLCFDRL
jgi:hypothetical protein